MEEDRNRKQNIPVQLDKGNATRDTGIPEAEKDPGSEQNKESQLSENGKRNIRWHVAAEAVIELVIRLNAHARHGASLDGLLVHHEEPLYTTIGKDPRKADTVAEIPRGVSIDGPIGEAFGECGSIEYKSPSDTFTKKNLYRSWMYTMSAAERKCGENGGGPNVTTGPATVIVCSHYPKKLFDEVIEDGATVEKSQDYKGVYILKGPNIQNTRFLVTRELEGDLPGYKWFTWLRDDLTLDEGRRLAEQCASAPKKEQEVALLVAKTALQANPVVMEKLLKETKMSDEVRRIIQPLVQEQYGAQIAEFEKKAELEKEEAVKEAVKEAVRKAEEGKDEAVRKAEEEKVEAVNKLKDVEQGFAALIASLSGSVNPEAMAKIQAFSEIFATN